MSEMINDVSNGGYMYIYMEERQRHGSLIVVCTIKTDTTIVTMTERERERERLCSTYISSDWKVQSFLSHGRNVYPSNNLID